MLREEEGTDKSWKVKHPPALPRVKNAYRDLTEYHNMAATSSNTLELCHTCARLTLIFSVSFQIATHGV